MSEILIPPWIIPEEESHEWLDEGSSVFRSAFAPGLAQRQSYGGLRLKLSRRHTVRLEEKAQLLSMLYATRGSYNTVWTKVHFARRGSIDASELLANGMFSSGTTGWTSGSAYTLSESDRILRAQRSAMTGAAVALQQSSTVTVAQYAPYLQRFMVTAGRGGHTVFAHRAGSSAGGSQYLSDVSATGPGLLGAAFVPTSTTAGISLVDGATTGLIAGDYFLVPYVSLARCALIDGGGNNLLHSDAMDNAAWVKTACTVGVGSSVAPDGTSTAETLTDDGTNAAHHVRQNTTVSSSALDLTFGCFLKAGTRGWSYLLMEEQTGGTSAGAYFNLSSGAVGTTFSGANMTNIRASITAHGNGWYYCTVTCRKTNAATIVTPRIASASADNTLTFAGDSTGGISMWRATSRTSSVPTRPIATTSAAASAETVTGTSVYLKGLPASTSGLLLSGDWVEIDGELKQLTAALNSDAAGLGFLQFEPALVNSPSNDQPVTIQEPMGKFLVSNIKIDNEFGTQARVSYDLEHVYE